MNAIDVTTPREANSSAEDSPPPSLTGRQRTVMRVVLVIVGSLLALGSFVSLGVLASGLGGTRVVTDTKNLPTDMRALTIVTGDVPVTVHVNTDANANEPRVDLRLVTNSDDTQLAVTQEGDASRITLHDSGSGFLWFHRTGELRVILPPDTARNLSVTVDQGAGSLSVDSSLRELVAQTDHNASLAGSARLIDVNARGDIKTSSAIAVADSFKAHSGSGSISTEFRAAPRTTEATAEGDVKVQVPGPDPYRVRAESAESDSGTLVTVPQTPAQDAPAVTARSATGNVEVTELP
ncbi:hypothetical protein AU192_07260 [Mycobacterium lehmannii]|uniref:Adhesin domain-containing protein n=1 Tax=Mycobacterium lehmannii TaxID=2048550 RepID=A0A124EPI1_9MYCO|nr:hypothetical protein [Mycobacterium lehmannii]KUI15652.1 hypothetical protein AU192_07260 [Mycobacterium lehmannii]